MVYTRTYVEYFFVMQLSLILKLYEMRAMISFLYFYESEKSISTK